jgi:predicted nucleic acid-binding protein
MFNIIIDTGFWIALFDPAKNPINNKEANRIADEIENHNLIIPFPTLYEFINSRLSRRESKMAFEKILASPKVIKLSDSKYKDQALKNFFHNSKFANNDVSLVDEIIKLIILDKKLKIDYLAAFDIGLINFANSNGVKKI